MVRSAQITKVKDNSQSVCPAIQVKCAVDNTKQIITGIQYCAADRKAVNSFNGCLVGESHSAVITNSVYSRSGITFTSKAY